MAGVFKEQLAGELAYGPMAGVPLCDRRALGGPVDDRCGSHMSFSACCGKSGEAAQQVLRIAHRKSGCPPQRQIGVNSGHHERTSGHGDAMPRSVEVSTFA